MFPIPTHYQLLAGYVTIDSRSTDETNDCGEVIRRTTTENRNWVANIYDIINIGSKMTWSARNEGMDWVSNYANKATSFSSVSYGNLGTIRPGLTHEMIQSTGQQFALANPVYRYVPIPGLPGNNCRSFAVALYARISLL